MSLTIKQEEIMTIIVGFILTIIAFFPISTNIFNYTYNFADNAGYAVRLENEVQSFKVGTPYYLNLDNSPYIGEEVKIIPIAPLWENLYILIHSFIDPYHYINLLVLLNTFLGFIFSVIYLKNREKNIWLCMLGGTIFAFSSWLLTTSVWFNLAGTFFIPLLFIGLNNLRKQANFKNILILGIYGLCLGLSSIYYLPFVAIVLFSTILVYRTQIAVLLLLLFTIIGGSYFTYKLPFILFEGYGISYDFDSVYKANSLRTSRDPIELFIPNSQNFFTQDIQDFFSDTLKDIVPPNRFNTSMHVPIFILLFFIFSTFIHFKSPRKNKDITFFFVILFITFLFWLGDNIKLFGIDTGLNGILHYFKMLPNGGVIRKSSYFLFLMMFCIAVITITGFPKNMKSTSIVAITLIVGTFFTTLPNFNRPYHEISDIQLPCDILNNKKILQLPNTGYSEKLYTYHLQQSNCNNVKEILYENKAVKKTNTLFYEGNPNISKLIQNSYYGNISPSDLDYIIMYKNSIAYFFDFEKSGRYFRNSTKNLTNFSNLNIIIDNDAVTIYEINEI